MAEKSDLAVQLFHHVEWINKLDPVPLVVVVVWPDFWRAFKGIQVIASGQTAEEFYSVFTESRPKARLGKDGPVV